VPSRVCRGWIDFGIGVTAGNARSGSTYRAGQPDRSRPRPDSPCWQ
jgi:hypothetical protein